MSEVQTPSVAPVKKVAKKAVAKKVAKKVVKKTPAKKVEAKKAPGGPKKDGLRNGQIRIITALAKKPETALTRSQISAKAEVDNANLVELIGSHDADKRAANDVKHFPSLITLGLVKATQQDIEGRDTVVYQITAKGKAEAAKLANVK